MKDRENHRGLYWYKSILGDLIQIRTKMASVTTGTALYMLIEVLGKSMSVMWGISSITIILDYYPWGLLDILQSSAPD